VTATGEAEVQIRITDMNDNVPYFKDRIYTARVPENTDAGTVVISVTAEDKDEGKMFSTCCLYTVQWLTLLFVTSYVASKLLLLLRM